MRARAVRVAQVCPEGLAFRLSQRRQVEFLRDRGYEVHAVTNRGPHEGLLRDLGIPCHPVPFTRSLAPLRDLLALEALVRIFRRQRFDIVHTHAPKGGLLGPIAAALAGVPIVVHTVHGYFFGRELPGWAREALIALERVSALGMDHILSQSAEDVALARRRHIARRARVSVLGNGIDLARFDPARVDPPPARMRARLGIAGQAPVVGMVGRYVRSKGYPEFFQAARLLLDRVSAVRFLVVGTRMSDERDGLAADDPGFAALGPAAVLLENRDDMPALYAAMDVLLQPSHHEGFSRTAMEAAAMGIPVVASDVSGHRAAVRPGLTGLIVPRHDAGALAARTAWLLEHPPERAAMSRAARAHARRCFDEEAVCRRIAATYERLLAGLGRRTPAGGQPGLLEL